MVAAAARGGGLDVASLVRTDRTARGPSLARNPRHVPEVDRAIQQERGQSISTDDWDLDGSHPMAALTIARKFVRAQNCAGCCRCETHSFCSLPSSLLRRSLKSRARTNSKRAERDIPLR